MVSFFSGKSVKLKRNLKMRNENIWLVTLAQTPWLTLFSIPSERYYKRELIDSQWKGVWPQILFFLLWSHCGVVFYEFRWYLFIMFSTWCSSFCHGFCIFLTCSVEWNYDVRTTPYVPLCAFGTVLERSRVTALHICQHTYTAYALLSALVLNSAKWSYWSTRSEGPKICHENERHNVDDDTGNYKVESKC